MRACDLLDRLALEHRDLHDRLDGLLAASDGPDREAVAALLVDLARHEAVEEVLVRPLLRRQTAGTRLPAVDDAQLEFDLLAARVDGVARAVGGSLGTSSGRRRRALQHLQHVLVGHTDRDEIERFPAVRHLVDPAELRRLADAADELLERLRAAGIPAPGARRPLETALATASEHVRPRTTDGERTIVVPDPVRTARRPPSRARTGGST